MTWEYQTIKLELEKNWSGVILNPDELNKTLNENGAASWELVSTVDTQSLGTTVEVTLIFKRPRAGAS